jgi:hypothetical protein
MYTELFVGLMIENFTMGQIVLKTASNKVVKHEQILPP